jgi:hypothetical protein
MIRADVEEIMTHIDALRAFDLIPLEKLELYENGQKVELSPEVIENWKFVGLNNKDFVALRIWEDPNLVRVLFEE